MGLPIKRATLKVTTMLLLLCVSLFFILCLFFYTDIKLIIKEWSALLPVLSVFLIITMVIVAARATMVTWITVLVLLAFAGKRRKVLVKHGSMITSDVALFLFRPWLFQKL